MIKADCERAFGVPPLTSALSWPGKENDKKNE